MADLDLPTGPVPANWRIVRLGEITSKIGSGSTPRGGSNVYTSEGVAFIRSQNVLDHQFSQDGLAFITDSAAHDLRGVEVKDGDVLMNITGDSILRTCVVPKSVLPARVSQHVAIIRPSGSIDPLVLQKYLALPAMKEYMLGHSTGGTRKAITKSHIENFIVPVPPLTEQRTIAEVLGVLDDKIVCNRRILAMVDELIISLSRSTSGNKLVPLSELAIVARQSVDPTSFGSLLVDHFSLPAFDATRVPEHCLANSIMSGKFRILHRSVLVSRLNPKIKRNWLAQPRDVPAVCSTEFLVLQPTVGSSIAAIWLAIENIQFQSELLSRATGTSGSHQRVNAADALSVLVPDPRTGSGLFLEECAQLLDMTLILLSESSSLRSMRDALLPELLSGRLRVPHAETLVEALV
jgi:type I restriction enzyme S subunit